MDRHTARTIVRNSAGDARVIWSIFSGYHPQELRESGAQKIKMDDLFGDLPPPCNTENRIYFLP